MKMLCALHLNLSEPKLSPFQTSRHSWSEWGRHAVFFNLMWCYAFCCLSLSDTICYDMDELQINDANARALDCGQLMLFSEWVGELLRQPPELLISFCGATRNATWLLGVSKGIGSRKYSMQTELWDHLMPELLNGISYVQVSSKESRQTWDCGGVC